MRIQRKSGAAFAVCADLFAIPASVWLETMRQLLSWAASRHDWASYAQDVEMDYYYPCSNCLDGDRGDHFFASVCDRVESPGTHEEALVVWEAETALEVKGGSALHQMEAVAERKLPQVLLRKVASTTRKAQTSVKGEVGGREGGEQLVGGRPVGDYMHLPLEEEEGARCIPAEEMVLIQNVQGVVVRDKRLRVVARGAAGGRR